MVQALRRYIVGLIAILCLAIGGLVFFQRDGAAEKSRHDVSVSSSRDLKQAKKKKLREAAIHKKVTGASVSEERGASGQEVEPSETEELSDDERREAEEEKLVDAFDALTDSWMESEEKKQVTMADIQKFCQQFRKIPKARQDECLHRALNLIPDENVMLLAGILMDKSFGADVLELVYNDILNRDEDVKKPILQEVFKDKTHPCWADTAWILDVTGELPGRKRE